jgi:hypothetical protein
MSHFTIERGTVPLCTWEIDTGNAACQQGAECRDGILVLEETDKVAFVIDPASQDVEYRISIGDVPLSEITPAADDVGGVALGCRLVWRQFRYFESARGHTRVTVEAQAIGAPVDSWKVALVATVYVLPSKIGEDRYQYMVGDLEVLNRSLLIDLYGKSQQTYDTRLAREGRGYQSREQELASIEAVLDRLSLVLLAIGRRPASCVCAVPWLQHYWGSERLAPAAVVAMCGRGVAPRAANLPLVVRNYRRMESFDIPEHRVIRAFLGILLRRSVFCGRAARGHVGAIMLERNLRDVRLRDGPTLYESVDLPRIRRLEEGIRKATRSASLVTRLIGLPFLNGVRPELSAIRGGIFQRSQDYQAALRIIRPFLVANAVWYEGDDTSAVTKLTSRLFEQWAYLRVVEAFRRCGLDLREWTDVLRQNLRSRFILDFDRGLSFEGKLGPDLRLRIRYEPWILSQSSAIRAGESLCRGSSEQVAWSPDIVVECLRMVEGRWQTVYGIVLDCKYTTRVRDHHWTGTMKYLQIRSTETLGQVVRQLWLVSPGARAGLKCEDPAVAFLPTGPSCARDEAVRFRLTAVPESTAVKANSVAGRDDPFAEFARGTVGFLLREFSCGAAA